MKQTNQRHEKPIPHAAASQTRRRFIRSTALLTAGMAQTAANRCGAAAAAKQVRVDAHLHCFAGSDPRFPYHARAPYRPTEPATPERLLQCMDDAGVDFAVVVHPEPYQDDHRYLEHCLEIGAGRLKGTCLFFADRPGAVKQLNSLARRVPIVAARIHAYAPDRLPPLGKPELRNLWKAIAELELAVQLHLEPRYAPQLEPLIREFSETRVIIDHLGRPFQGTPEEHEVIVRWAQLPNTMIKLSAIPSPLNYPHRDPAAVIKRLSLEFGPERMIYGGGYGAGASGESYQAAFELARSYLTHLSAVDQGKILGQNAANYFGFA